jgi:opacity protein-like surface antigen
MPKLNHRFKCVFFADNGTKCMICKNTKNHISNGYITSILIVASLLCGHAAHADTTLVGSSDVRASTDGSVQKQSQKISISGQAGSSYVVSATVAAPRAYKLIIYDNPKAMHQDNERQEQKNMAMHQDNERSEQKNMAMYQDNEQSEQKNMAMYQDNERSEQKNMAMYQDYEQSEQKNMAMYQDYERSEQKNMAMYQDYERSEQKNMAGDKKWSIGAKFDFSLISFTNRYSLLSDPSDSETDNFRAKPQLGFDVSIGYQLSRKWRAELDYWHSGTYSEKDSYMSFDLGASTITLNGIYNIKEWTTTCVYIGAGVGAGYLTTEWTAPVGTFDSNTDTGKSSIGFTGQLQFGIEEKIADNFSLGLNYKLGYLAGQTQNILLGDGSGDSWVVKTGGILTNTFGLGLRFTF